MLLAVAVVYFLARGEQGRQTGSYGRLRWRQCRRRNHRMSLVECPPKSSPLSLKNSVKYLLRVSWLLPI